MSKMKTRKIPFTSPSLVARWPYINEPDTKFGGTPKFKCDLFLDDSKEATELVERIKSCAEEWHGNKKGVTLPIGNDEAAGQEYLKTWTYNQPLVVDAEGNPIPPASLPRIRMGSQVRIQGSIAENTTIPGVRLEMRVIKILELVESNSIPDEFKAVEGSYVAKHDDSVVEDAHNEEEPPAKKAASF